MQRVRQLEKEDRHEEAVEFGRHFDIDVHHVQETTLQQIFEPDIRRHTIFLSLAFLTNWIGIQVFAVLGTTVLTEGKGVSFGSALTVLISPTRPLTSATSATGTWVIASDGASPSPAAG